MPSIPDIPEESREKMKREGWASMEEQQQYWTNKAKMDALIQGIDAFADFVDDLNIAMSKLKRKLEIIRDQGGDEKH